MYAWWVGRERPRAVLRAAALPHRRGRRACSAAQDLLVFYAFFEAMLIPLYVLIGVWGGAGRLARDDQVHRLHGRRLAADAGGDRRLRPAAGDVRPDGRWGTSSNDWLFLGFAIAFAVKAPLWPFHGWLPDAYRESPAEVAGLLSGVISKVAATASCGSRSRSSPARRTTSACRSSRSPSIGLVYGSLLAFRAPDIRGVIAYSSLAQMGLITFGLFASNDARLRRRGAADGQPRADLDDALPARRHGRAAHGDRRARRCSAGWPAGGPRSRPC